MKPIYDSRDISCKSPFGAAKTGHAVNFSIHLPKIKLDREPVIKLFSLDAKRKTIIMQMSLSHADAVCNTYSCTFTPQEAMLLEYSFEIFANGCIQEIKRCEDNTGAFNANGKWQLTVYDSAMRTPEFMREGMFYQIFPDRFYNSGKEKKNIPSDRILRNDWGSLPCWRPNADGEVTNSDYFCGDLAGITQKLDYLESLGVTIIYLNPIFEAHSNHRYNTADYMKIDPLLGDEDDFAELCTQAKKRGINIILDGVFNHIGSDSKYFNKRYRYGNGGAYNDYNSPYRKWFKFTEYPHKYESWWGFKTLPDVDESNPEYREYICGENGVLKHWLRLGASGFRLDVADELPDDFLDDINACIKSHSSDCAMIGEVWEDASNKISYGERRRYLLGKQFDSIMNYPFMNAVIGYIRYGKGADFCSSVMQIIENYPAPVLAALMNMLSTHDTSRVLTELVAESSEGKDREWQENHHYLPLDDYHKACRLYLLASIMQFGLPGLPCVYYGDEAGLSGYRDPFNRVCYPWGHENHELIGKIAELGKLRRDFPVFAEASFVPLVFSDEVCAFVRENKNTKILFVINRTESEQKIYLPSEFAEAEPHIVFGGYSAGQLGALSGAVIVIE